MPSYRFLLRRTAARAIWAAPSKAFLAHPRSITSIAPAAFRRQQQQGSLALFQRRFASDDATKIDTAEPAVTETEDFAQTAAEAPVEENVTLAQQETEASVEKNADSDAFTGQDGVHQDSEKPPSSGRQQSPGPPGTRLYVGNLFYEVKEEQLKRVFSRFGEVTGVRLVYDNRGYSRGFAYIDFSTIEEAQSAIDSLNMQVFEGRNLIVQFHREKVAAVGGEKRVNPPSDTLFIGNMSYEMSDKDLNELFRDIRNVIDVRVAVDRRTGQPRGFAHAEFVDVASATHAKEILSEKSTYGRRLRIDFSASVSSKNKDRDSRSDSAMGV